MGTNYYLVKPPCTKCGRRPDDMRLHIGKSSAGWCFLLHVYPEDQIRDLDGWILRWREPDVEIIDEYGEVCSRTALLEQITNRGTPALSRASLEVLTKPFGYKSWVEFHEMNKSEPGPRGLLRHRIDGQHCIGHGEGTWDYIVGEFS